jgi:hypothetical protein
MTAAFHLTDWPRATGATIGNGRKLDRFARKLVSGSSLQMSQVFSDGHRPQVGRGAVRRNRAIARVGPTHSLAKRSLSIHTV